jgi:predicted nuclease of predicted toxin-antitoxin system
MRLLLDENISPALVVRLAEVGVYAQSVPHVGLAGRADRALWQYALHHDFAVVTVNARDFIELLDVAGHPGLIVLRESGLSRKEQWERIKPVIDHVQDSGDQDFLLNKLVEVTGVENSTHEIFRCPRIRIVLSPRSQGLAGDSAGRSTSWSGVLP